MCAYMYIDCGMFYHMYMRDRSFLFPKPFTNTNYCATKLCFKNTIENRDSRCNFNYCATTLRSETQAKITTADATSITRPIVKNSS